MSAETHVYPNAEKTAAACAHRITANLEEALAGNDIATIALSGGSTPKLLFERLVNEPIDWKRVHIFWVDERCVAPSSDQSNFRLAEEHLLKPGRISSRQVHRICGEMMPDAAAKRYVEEIQDFFGLEDGQFPHFDIVQRGMGPDAHTASLFPGEPLIENREQIAAAVFVEKLNSWRVTLLPGALMAAKHTLFLVCGEDKAAAVNWVFNEEYDPMRYPAQMASHHGRKVAWFLDRAAAAGLD